MSTTPYPGQPIAKNFVPDHQAPPNVVANQRYTLENGSASSVMTVADATTMIEVAAIGQGAVIKWIASSDTTASVISAAGTANYDNVVPVNAVRRFAIPIERQGVASIVGAGVQAGLYRRVAVKSTAAGGSVLTVEL